MGRCVSVVLMLVVVGSVAGTVSAVPIGAFPQHVTQNDHEVPSDEQVSIDARSTVYAGSAIQGYDVTVRNDGIQNLTVKVTVRLSTLDGTVVATASAENLVLIGTSDTFAVRFDAAVPSSAFDRVGVEAVES